MKEKISRPRGGRKTWERFFLAGLTLILLSSSSWALDVPARPEGRVTDPTRTLSPSEIATLERKLAAFERETTHQIAVLIIPSLEGDNLEDYSIRLAEKWKIGQKGRNNGAILLVVKNDRKLRIEVGYGLEGALPDALAGTIIRNEIAPRFRAGQFYQGIDAGINAMMAATKGEYKASPKRGKGSRGLPLWVVFFLPMVFIFVVLAFMNRRGQKKALSFRRFRRLDDGRWILRGRVFLGRFRGIFRRGRRFRRRRGERRLVKFLWDADERRLSGLQIQRIDRLDH